MSQLHDDPVLGEAAVPTPGSGTLLDGPAEAAPTRSVGTREEVLPTTPVRRGDAALRKREKKVTGSRTTSVRPIAAGPAAPGSPLAESQDLAERTGQAEDTARAGLEEVAPELPAPLAGPAVDEDTDDSRADDEAAATAPGFAPEATGSAGGGTPERCTVPVVRAGRGRHRPAPARRRPVVHLAAALVTAAGLGVVTGGTPEASAESAPPVRESVSVARALGLEGGPARAPIGTEAEVLGELAASRTSRDLERFAAAAAQEEADQLTALAIAEAARPDAVLPVQGARLTSGFGARWGTIHAGIDLAAPMYTPEYAVMDGVVLEAGPASGYGNVVYVQHDNGDVTVYGHMEEILVAPGQVVRAGDTIALLGNRGQSTGPHLHFEVRIGGLNGTRVDPVPWLRERGVEI